MSLPPGTRLGSYEVQALIGAGGMGEVYRARDIRLGREVAVKVLPPAFAGNPERMRRFDLEARAAASLSHPNIRAVHDVGWHLGSCYLVMELLSGETLRDRMGGRPLPPRKAAEIALQVARGLAAAHQKGIVHRDLKPENLFLTRDGLVKILDFGLAKAFVAEGAEDPATLGVERGRLETSEGVVLGTVGYLSPEQVRGDKVDARADLFAFGVVLWEMLTGTRPFQGASAVEIMHAILREEPPALDAALEIPPVLARVAASCLEKDPAARFQSAHDLAFALEALSGSVSTQALEARASLPRRRRRFWGVAAGAAAALLLAGSAWGLGILRARNPAPAFKRLTYLRGTLERAVFTNQGATVRMSARLEGRATALFDLVQGSPEAIPVGEPGITLLAASSRNDLAVLRDARVLNGIIEGTLAQANPGGTGLRDLGEPVVCADWAPDARSLALVRRKEGYDGYRIECPQGRVVYETAMAVQGLRFSPDGTRLLFLESDETPEARLTLLRRLRCLDLQGGVRTLYHGGRLSGAAWHRSGREIWLGEVEGDQTSLALVSLSGSRRILWRGAGEFQILDADARGRLLLAHHQVQRQSEILDESGAFPRTLSWLGACWASAFSADGTSLLFNAEWGGQQGLYLWKARAAAPIRLGPGMGLDFTWDGARVVVRNPGGQMLLLPLGAGTMKELTPGPCIVDKAWACPDGRRILYHQMEPPPEGQMFVYDLEKDTRQVIGELGEDVWTGQNPLSPDGTRMALVHFDTRAPGEKVAVVHADGRTRKLVREIQAQDVIIGFAPDGQGLLVYDRCAIPVRIERIDLASGRRELWRTFTPADPVGIRGVDTIVVSRDGRRLAFNYERTLSELFLAEGLE